EIDPELDPLGRSQHHVRLAHGRLQQAAVRPDDSDRSAVRPRQAIDAAVRAVEDAESIRTSGDAQSEVGLPVDDDPIAQKARHALHRGGQVDELIARVEASILNDQRDAESPRRELRDRLAWVLDDEEPGKPPVHLLARPSVGMSMVPVRPGRALDLELVDVLTSSSDRLARVTGGRPGDVQSVPVHDGLFADVAGENDTHPLPGSHAEGRTERAARDVLERARIASHDAALKGPYVRRVAGQHAGLRWRRLEGDLHVWVEGHRSRSGVGPGSPSAMEPPG